MKRENLKSEIHKIIDKVPDVVLENIYDILKSFENKDADKIKLSHYLNKILKEDKQLLERLAK